MFNRSIFFNLYQEKKPLTKEDVIHWLGSDNTLEEAVDVIWGIAEGKYPYWLLSKDILNSKEELKPEGVSDGVL